jgi:hypothetical protein
LHFDINVEFDVTIFRLGLDMVSLIRRHPSRRGATDPHEQPNRLLERWNGLFRFLHGPDMFHSIISVPVSLFDLAYTAGALLANRSSRAGNQGHGIQKSNRPTYRVRRPSERCAGAGSQRMCRRQENTPTRIVEHDNNIIP